MLLFTKQVAKRSRKDSMKLSLLILWREKDEEEEAKDSLLCIYIMCNSTNITYRIITASCNSCVFVRSTLYVFLIIKIFNNDNGIKILQT